jgi:hypothetical protein
MQKRIERKETMPSSTAVVLKTSTFYHSRPNKSRASGRSMSVSGSRQVGHTTWNAIRAFCVFPTRLQVRSYLLLSFSYALLPPFCISLFRFVTELLAHANDDDNTPSRNRICSHTGEKRGRKKRKKQPGKELAYSTVSRTTCQARPN